VKRTVLAYFLFLIIPEIRSQDIHFSQYYLSPLSLNPANTGKYKGDYRFFGNYRSQWRDIDRAYNTFSAGGDFNAYPYNQNLSGGLIFINDNSGGNLMVNKILPSGAIHKTIRFWQLHVGIQPGLVIKSIDFYKNSFPNQLNWETGVFDNELPNNESKVQQRFMYFDLNAGVGITRKFSKVEIDAGYALFHLNEPRESFFGGRSILHMRQSYNLALGYYLTPLFIIRLHSLCAYTQKVTDWISGMNLEYVISKNAFFTNSVFGGFMWRSGLNRNPDAGIATIGFNYSQYTIGFSFDITNSQLKTAVDNKGAYEIGFIYRAKSTRLTRKAVPCERY
jgi:type IX secretion system PorP/SprF family membrane protein